MTVALDPLSTPAGLMERLFLHETLSPGYVRKYDRNRSLRAMRLMKQVVENRLKDAEHWGASGAINEIPIIKVKGQFGKFALYPDLPKEFMSGVTGIIALAGDPRHPLHDVYAQHMQDAVTAATEPVAPADIVALKAVAWMKDNNSPGKSFRIVAMEQGNTFFAKKA